MTKQIDESAFEGLDAEKLREIARGVLEIEKALEAEGPETDDELWHWVKNNLGLEIPRTSVCEGHDSPFKFLADAYFHRYPAILAMGNRGGGKTFMVALLHWLNSTFKPGIESATFGATENQSLRCYAHLKNWIYDEDGNKRSGVRSSVMRETVWKTGSKVEVLAGTPEAVNGPHPQIVHGDEVELMRDDTWRESRNMAVSKTLSDGTIYYSQEILTSTRKGLQGRMQKLINQIKEAEDAGKIPAYKLITWCIFEIAKEVPSCQMAPEELRTKRLEELDRDPCETCDCDKYMQGHWPTETIIENGKEKPKPRLLNEVCRGRLFRSRGFMPYEDVVQKFQQNSRQTWEAQQECSKPETEFNYLQNYAEELVGIRNYEPLPGNGPIYMSVDWGGTNPHSVNWYQQLRTPVDVQDFYGETRTLKEGTIVVFGEIYKAEIGVIRLAKLVKTEEMKWKIRYEGWKVSGRFADPQGASARKDFKENGLPTTWHTTREFDVQVEWLVREIWEKELLVVDLDECPMWNKEAQSWQKDPKKPEQQLDEFNHAMSNLRYATANIRKLNQRSGGSAPQTTKKQHKTAGYVKDTRQQLQGGPIHVRGSTTDDWRRRLGGPGMSRSPFSR